MRWLARCVALVGFLTALSACRPADLAHTRPSAEALGRAILDALARHDLVGLRQLALNEEEFAAHVWPSLPAARPERNLPLSYVWGDLRQKSDTFLASTLLTHGGQPYVFVRVSMPTPAQDYAAFRIYRDVTVVVRDDATAEQHLRVCGSLIEKDGLWKVFSYITDD